MSDAQKNPIVELRGVRVPADWPYDTALAVDSFALNAGELAVVEVARDIQCAPLDDLLSGLLVADEGDAFFQGMNWRTASADDASRARSRIGRVFDGAGADWISNLDLDENVTLGLRYHGLSEAEAQSRLERLARVAGCWPLPEGRPGSVPKNLLCRVEWVRAFINEPVLVLLENPLRDIHGDSAAGLAALTDAAQKRGAAILWMATEGEAWQSVLPKPATRWRLSGGRLDAVETK